MVKIIPENFPKDNYHRKSFSQKYILGLTNILFYTGFLPYRLAVHIWPSQPNIPPKMEVIQVKDSVQTVICLTVHSLAASTTCFMIYSFIYANHLSEGKPLSFLEATLFMWRPVITFYYIYIAWFRQHWLEWLVIESSPKSKSIISDGSKVESVTETCRSWLTVIYPLLSIPLVAAQEYIFYYKLYKEHAPIQLSSLFEEGDMIGDYVDKCFFILLLFINIVVAYMVNAMFQAATLSYRDRTNEFIQMVEENELGVIEEKGHAQDSTEDILYIPGKYLELESYAKGVNTRYGRWISAIVIFHVLFYSKRLADLLNGHLSGYTVVYTIAIFSWIFTTADACNQICEQMKTWIDRNHARLSSQQMTLFTNKVNQNSIALRGGNYFAVSYPLIGTIVSLIITCAFIDQSKGWTDVNINSAG